MHRRAIVLSVFVAALGVFGATANAGATGSQPLVLPEQNATAVGTGAGYLAYPGDFDGIASVGATFKVPTATCQRANDEEWLRPGIWVFDSDGHQTQQVSVNLDCDHGALDRYSDICVTGTCSTDLAVSPGDVIEASLVYTPSSTVGTLRDRTQGTSSQVRGVFDDADNTVLVGALGPNESGSGVTRVPTFTSMPFSTVQINGQYLGDWTQTPINLETVRAVQIKTGAITHNQNFKLTFAHN